MQNHRRERKLSFLVWSRYEPEEGKRIIPGHPAPTDRTDWLQLTPFETQILAEACAHCPDRYSQNLAATLNKELDTIKAAQTEELSFP